ncbi:MAG TPA: PAS domain S-box protein [Candidatus Polarisedimenticolaceae bacterium]
MGGGGPEPEVDFYRLMVEGAEGLFFYIHDAEHRFTWLSPSVRSVLGFEPEELLGRPYDDLLDPGRPANGVHASTDGALADGVRREPYEAFVRRKDGTGIVLELIEEPFPAPDGPTRMRGFARDITRRKEEQDALRRSERRFRSLVEATSDWIWEVDRNGRYTYVSPKVVDLLGYSVEEILGRSPFDLIVPEERDAVRAAFERCVREKRPIARLENTNLRSDGGRVVLETSGVPLFSETGQLTGFHGVDRDVTDRKRLELQFLQAQRLEAVGRLAGGIAHDFNNLLTVILGFNELASTSAAAEASPELRQRLGEIRKASERAASLVRKILAFSRRQVVELRVVDLHAGLNELAPMLRRLLGEDVTLALRFTSRPALVKADPTQIEQVVVNLAVNARDAMPEGGTLSIETEIVDLDGGAGSSECVRLTVADTGTGMPPEVLGKIFEPFFTTKPLGVGTGLGLSTVYGLVRQLEGDILVESRPGAGTTFTIHLPTSRERRSAERPRTSEGEIPLGTESVMVVEDEPAIRRVVEDALRACGYEVHAPATAEEALEILTRRPDRFALLLTDVVMPGLSGPALAERVRAVAPKVRLVFMSGYAEEVIARHGGEASGTPFLPKPFTIAQLARKVREVLDAGETEVR